MARARGRFSRRHAAVLDRAPGLGTLVPRRHGDDRVRVPDDRHGARRGAGRSSIAGCAAAGRSAGCEILTPLESLESGCFQSILAGFLLLTLALVSGAFFVENLFAQHLVHKVMLAIVAWVRVRRAAARAVALRLARHGRPALDASGYTLLGLSYFGSKLILETCSASTGAERPCSTYRCGAHPRPRLLLIVLSAFFSSTETALMSVNRYRLRHLAREGSRGARAAEKLLERPDRLIGMILICNNFVNTAAAAIVTVISAGAAVARYAAAIGVGLFTVVLIIFGEVAPKTFGALYPERIALPAAVVYTVLLKVLYPIVWADQPGRERRVAAARRLAREGRAARR